MRKLRKIKKDLQPQIDEVINSLLSECEVEYDSEGIKGYIADVSRGMSYEKDKQFTVPLWAYDKRVKNNYRSEEGYFKYYVAHELAHQLRYIKYDDTDGCHDYRFYEIFMDICPKELQHFELHYKPSSAKYGISNI